MSEIPLTEVNLQKVGVKRVVKSHFRIKQFKKIKSKRKRKNNSYFKRKRLIRALVLRMDKSQTTDQGCSKLWQNKEETAFWKARAISLEFENKMLHKHIKQMYINVINQKTENATEHYENLEDYECDEELEDPGLVNQNNLEYYDQMPQEIKETDFNNKDNKRHNYSSKKGRVRTNEDKAESQPPTEQASKRREEDMKLLYGKAWRKIMGMETAVQLKFDLNVEKSNLNYWPVVPM